MTTQPKSLLAMPEDDPVPWLTSQWRKNGCFAVGPKDLTPQNVAAAKGKPFDGISVAMSATLNSVTNAVKALHDAADAYSVAFGNSSDEATEGGFTDFSQRRVVLGARALRDVTLTEGQRAAIMVGLAAHEVGHIRWTATNWQAAQAAFSGGPDAFVASQVSNVAEDLRVESLLRRDFEGIAATIDVMLWYSTKWQIDGAAAQGVTLPAKPRLDTVKGRLSFWLAATRWVDMLDFSDTEGELEFAQQWAIRATEAHTPDKHLALIREALDWINDLPTEEPQEEPEESESEDSEGEPEGEQEEPQEPKGEQEGEPEEGEDGDDTEGEDDEGGEPGEDSTEGGEDGEEPTDEPTDGEGEDADGDDTEGEGEDEGEESESESGTEGEGTDGDGEEESESDEPTEGEGGEGGHEAADDGEAEDGEDEDDIDSGAGQGTEGEGPDGSGHEQGEDDDSHGVGGEHMDGDTEGDDRLPDSIDIADCAAEANRDEDLDALMDEAVSAHVRASRKVKRVRFYANADDPSKRVAVRERRVSHGNEATGPRMAFANTHGFEPEGLAEASEDIGGEQFTEDLRKRYREAFGSDAEGDRQFETAKRNKERDVARMMAEKASREDTVAAKTLVNVLTSARKGEGMPERGHRSGRVDRAALHKVRQGDGRVFMRRTAVAPQRVRAHILVDCSGSMSGRIRNAVQSARNIAHALDMIEWAQGAVYGHTTDGHGVYVTRVWSSGEPRERINDLHKVQLSGNEDGYAIAYVADDLLDELRGGEKGVVLVISDGMPAYDNGHAHVRSVTDYYRKRGLRVVAVSLSSGLRGATFASMYGGDVVEFDANPKVFARNLAKVIGSAL